MPFGWRRSAFPSLHGRIERLPKWASLRVFGSANDALSYFSRRQFYLHARTFRT
jgi:hypothetical protein